MIWRLDKKLAGSGALGDLGAHIIDLARFLVGEPKSVMAMTTHLHHRAPAADGSGTGKVDVDDAFEAVVEFENGAVGTLEASRFAPGRKNHQVFEINGEKGSIRFNLERFNELEVFWDDDAPTRDAGLHRRAGHASRTTPSGRTGGRTGHIIGWEHTFVHEIAHLLDCIVNDKDVAPLRRDLRGRLPQRRHLRRHPPVGGGRPQGSTIEF